MKPNFDFPRNAAWLDDQLNNRNRVPEFLSHIERWRANSAQARASLPADLDLPYSVGGASYTLDVFSTTSKRPAPVVVFIHGGYWRSMDKMDHSFFAPAFVQAGACVVIPNYPLCPQVTIEQLIISQVQAICWVYRHIAAHGGDQQRISVVGHSAGGHLAAMMLSCRWHMLSADLPADVVKRAISLSGLHDLEPMRHSPYLQSDLQLTASQVRRCSPAYFPQPEGQLAALCGADESQEFIRQCRLIQQAWGKAKVPVCETLEGKNHFSVLEALTTPSETAHQLARQFLGI